MYADANGGGTDKTVALRFLNASNNVLAVFAQNVPGNTNGYALFSMTGTAPAGTAWAQVYWSIGQGDGCLYMDDWCLQQSPSQQQLPPGLVLLNGSERYSEAQKDNYFSPEIFTLYPNPAKDELFVFGHQNGANEDFSFVVTDFLGKEIREVKGKFEADNPFKISLDGLANGTYCLQIRGNGIRNVTRKFVVVRQ